MTEAVVSLPIKNGDDLLTLKEVIYKKSDKDNGDEQKHSDSKQTNGNELNENDNITDGKVFDTDRTSSLEPNFQTDSDTDRNIIDSICTHDEIESECLEASNDDSNEADAINDNSNEADAINDNSNEADAINDNEDNQAVSIDCSGSSHSSDDMEDSESKNIKLSLSTSYSNMSSRLPLAGYKELDEDYLQHEVKKRKFEEIPPEDEQFLPKKKMQMLSDKVKHPIKKATENTKTEETEENTTKWKFCSIM